MSLLLEPSNSADTVRVGEESQNNEYDVQSLAWRNIKFDEKKMTAAKGVIEKIANGTINRPLTNRILLLVIEAAKASYKISSGIDVIMISLRLLARITNPLLFSGCETAVTRRISSGLQAVLRSCSQSFGSHTRNRRIDHWFGHLPGLETMSFILLSMWHLHMRRNPVFAN